LPKEANERVTAILASPRVGERVPRQHARPQGVIEFAAGEQPSIGGDDRASELQHHPAVEIEPQATVVRFTRPVRHGSGSKERRNHRKIYLNRDSHTINL
jgi:hypothetical protein